VTRQITRVRAERYTERFREIVEPVAHRLASGSPSP